MVIYTYPLLAGLAALFAGISLTLGVGFALVTCGALMLAYVVVVGSIAGRR